MLDRFRLSAVVTAICHQGALQLHGPTVEQEKNTYGESVVRVWNIEAKCDRRTQEKWLGGRNVGKVI